jgi:outer membrane protein OmpA-like peptidoglycan-associated protein/uncharacterized protein YegP (UPF0339 family)
MITGHDNYLDCEGYKGNTDDAGFNRFAIEATFYFSFIEDGKVILCSEGYLSESARDNGIESVKKNIENEEQYKSVDTGNGKWALSLRAANHKEIARSCEVDSEAATKQYLPSERAKARAARLAAAPVAVAATTGTDDDDYLICREYEEKFDKAKLDDGIIGFQHEKTGHYYFAWYNNDGGVILRSEAYPSASARDNGIESVKKNRGDKSRYSNIEAKGAHFLILKAGNHKEIGRSCPKKTVAEAFGLVSILGAGAAASATAFASEAPKVDQVTAPIVEAPKVEEVKAPVVEVPKVEEIKTPIVEIAKPAPEKIEVAAAAPIAAVGAAAASLHIETPKAEIPKVEASATSYASAAKTTASTYMPNTDVDSAASSGCMRYWWLALLAAALLLFFLWWKGCEQLGFKGRNAAATTINDSTNVNATDANASNTADTNSNTSTPAAVDNTLDSAAQAAQAKWASLGSLIEVKLPDGVSIKVPANGDEKKLIDFLNDGCQGDLKANWFNLDRVLFKTGKAELNEVSRDQINNLTAIFKAYPNATFKIGGYTDNVGSVASNKKLSGARAATTVNEIVKNGIVATRLASEGYGPENPVCAANDTEECKAKNRRVAIRITKCN